MREKMLGLAGTHWLKTVHLGFAGLWLGGAFAVVLGQYVLDASEGMQLYGHDVAFKFIDDFVIIPGAFGSLLTGLLYALLTPWGFFRHRWVVAKWIVTVGGIVVGTIWLGPWINGLPPLSLAKGLAALADPEYLHMKQMNRAVGTVQVAALAIAMGLSVFKPWNRTKKGGAA